MDRTEIVKALKIARTVVVAHGLANHVPERFKGGLTAEINDYSDFSQYEFYLYPKQSIWDSNNYSCALVIGYTPGQDIVIDGGIYRDHKRRLHIRYGSGEANLSDFKMRENFVSSLLMLCEMIESLTPESITVTVETPEEVIRRRRREYEQEIGNRIHGVLDKNDFKNLRRGGKARLVRIPDTYTSCYGSLPEQGTYAYRHAARRNRRGSVLEYVNYVFRVHPSSEGGSYVKISKV